jgi:hypothetical protein
MKRKNQKSNCFNIILLNRICPHSNETEKIEASKFTPNKNIPYPKNIIN